MIKMTLWFGLVWLITHCLPVPLDNYFKAANQLYDQGQYQQALQYYRKLFRHKEIGAEAYYNAGNAAYKQQQYKQAMELFEQAIQRLPEDEDIWHNFELARKKADQENKQLEKSKTQAKEKKPDQGKINISSTLADRMLQRAGSQEHRYQPYVNTQSRKKRKGSFSSDIFSLPPQQLFEYIKKQTQAGYPFKAGASIKKPKPPADVIDW